MAMAATKPIRKMNTALGKTSVIFNVPHVEAHKDTLLEIDVGKEATTLAVSVTFKPFYDGINPVVPQELLKAASVTLYASDTAVSRVANYRWQEEVTHNGGKMGEPVISLGKVEGTVYMALFAPIALADVVVECKIKHTVSCFDDLYHPWRISRMYHVTPENFDIVVEWFEKNKTKLILKSVELVDEQGQNPLHHLCATCGDPRLAKFYLKHCMRFMKPDLEDKHDQTPLMCLLKRADVYPPESPTYYRALELLELFGREVAVSTDRQDDLGNTMVHYAAAHHRRDSKLLPNLLALGPASTIKNNAGKTPYDMCQEEQYGLLSVDIHEVERLVERAPGPKNIPLRTLQVCDILPPRKLKAEDAGVAMLKDNPYPPNLVATDEKGQPVAKANPLSEDQLDWITRLFKDLDKNKNGWLSMSEMRAMYKAFDNYGVSETAAEIDKLVAAMGLNTDGRITFDEFCILLLKLNSR